MKKICVVCKKMFRKHWKRISIKDKALIIIMALLMWQSAYVLFSGDGANPNSKSIDVVVRTTSAAVFGYFLSANFLNRNAEKEEESKDGVIEETTCVCQTVKKIEKNKVDEVEDEQYKTYFITQIIIAATIGIVSLIILSIARDIPGIPIESISALAQFRDFVSGCVGFLIGIPSGKNSKS
ncbi:MAG: hypothetical protein ACRC1P_08185 [Cellulosilyticaceae bacterium]